jgi:hypothetical protein
LVCRFEKERRALREEREKLELERQRLELETEARDNEQLMIDLRLREKLIDEQVKAMEKERCIFSYYSQSNYS